jgi:myo-inositol 2-dehydrogenase/D-chiro-inositol 1-dehydrogenase
MPRDLAVRATADGLSSAVPVVDFLARYRPAYQAELDAFIRFAEGEDIGIADQNDGLEAQRLAEAALQSYQSQLPVTIMAAKGDTSSPGLEVSGTAKAA